MIGSLDLQKLSPTTRITLYNFWDLLAFVANSAVFLILGLQINIGELIDQAGAVAIAVLAILASRALVVYGAATNEEIIRFGRRVRDELGGAVQFVVSPAMGQKPDPDHCAQGGFDVQ